VALVIDRQVPSDGSLLLVKASVPPGSGAAAGAEGVARVLNLDAAAPPPAPRTPKKVGKETFAVDEATGAVFGADGMCAGAAGVGKFADFTKGHAETVPLPARKPKVAFAPAPVAEAEEEEDELVAGMGGLAVVEEEVVADVKEAPTRKSPDAVIAYPGGKGKAFPILSMLIPDRFKTLVSLCAGGAGFELAWRNAGADHEVWAYDADIDLINMYSCVKHRKEELRAELAALSEDDYDACVALLTTTPARGTEVKRAAAKIFAHKMSYMGRISAGRDRSCHRQAYGQGGHRPVAHAFRAQGRVRCAAGPCQAGLLLLPRPAV